MDLLAFVFVVDGSTILVDTRRAEGDIRPRLNSDSVSLEVEGGR